MFGEYVGNIWGILIPNISKIYENINYILFL